MSIPAQYDYLLDEPQPRILVEALKLYGTREILGSGSNPAILQWAQEVGAKRMGLQYKDDSVAWCGLFMAVCALRARQSVPPICVRALAWVQYGTAVNTPSLGDVLIFSRRGGGHVGLYVGEDKTAYHVLGGNQQDMVNIVRIDKARLTAVRRTLFKEKPASIRPIHLKPTGGLSDNEA